MLHSQSDCQDLYRSYALFAFGNCDDGTLHPNDALWTMETFDIEDLASVLGRPGWAKWLMDEISAREADIGEKCHWRAFLDAPDFQSALLNSCDGPCVISIDDNNAIQIWDGWHRIACAVVRGEPEFSLLVGRRFEPIPGPSM